MLVMVSAHANLTSYDFIFLHSFLPQSFGAPLGTTVFWKAKLFQKPKNKINLDMMIFSYYK